MSEKEAELENSGSGSFDHQKHGRDLLFDCHVLKGSVLESSEEVGCEHEESGFVTVETVELEQSDQPYPDLFDPD